MAFLKVKLRGENGVVNGPRVLKGAGKARAKRPRSDEVSIAKGGTPEGNNEFTTSLLDPYYHAPVGEDDILVNVGEECKKEDVEDHNPRVDGAPPEDPLVGMDPAIELGKRPFTNIHGGGGSAERNAKIDPVCAEANPSPSAVDKPKDNAVGGWSGGDDSEFF